MKAEKSPKVVDISPTEKEPMSDSQLAANLLDEVIGDRGIREPVKEMLERAYNALHKRNRAWTRRRVRAVFHQEAASIRYREIEEMRAVIQARKDHGAYREETARLAQMAIVRAAAQDGDLAP